MDKRAVVDFILEVVDHWNIEEVGDYRLNIIEPSGDRRISIGKFGDFTLDIDLERKNDGRSFLFDKVESVSVGPFLRMKILYSIWKQRSKIVNKAEEKKNKAVKDFLKL